MSKQTTFSNVSDEFKGYWKSTDRPFHGGAYAMGKRKTRRPYDSKRPIHLVLRSERARGELSMLRFRNRNHIHNIGHRFAVKFGGCVYEYSNNGNHLHILVHATFSEDFASFLKAITGLIASHDLTAH